MQTTTVPTPAGPLTIVAEADTGTVLASGWTDDPDVLVALIAPALRPSSVEPTDDLGPITDAVAAYLDGDLGAIDHVPVRQQSGPFLMEAWDVLRDVPAGAPVTYAEFAAKAGRPDATRAAANACARNAAALFVPCHRVVRTGGGLGGFRWGLDVKTWLLAHEAAAG
jgi:methylated-DNA-[protein]-cysteine S-methyltransferase